MIGAILAFAPIAVARADESVDMDLFSAANDLYVDGNFEEAALVYERLVRLGYQDATLYYNLANAYYRNEDMGRAMVNYLQRAPHSPVRRRHSRQPRACAGEGRNGGLRTPARAPSGAVSRVAAVAVIGSRRRRRAAVLVRRVDSRASMDSATSDVAPPNRRLAPSRHRRRHRLASVRIHSHRRPDEPRPLDRRRRRNRPIRRYAIRPQLPRRRQRIPRRRPRSNRPPNPRRLDPSASPKNRAGRLGTRILHRDRHTALTAIGAEHYFIHPDEPPSPSPRNAAQIILVQIRRAGVESCALIHGYSFTFAPLQCETAADVRSV